MQKNHLGHFSLSHPDTLVVSYPPVYKVELYLGAVQARPLGLSFTSHHFWPHVDYTLGNLESKSICTIPKFFWYYNSVKVLYKMVV